MFKVPDNKFKLPELLYPFAVPAMVARTFIVPPLILITEADAVVNKLFTVNNNINVQVSNNIIFENNIVSIVNNNQYNISSKYYNTNIINNVYNYKLLPYNFISDNTNNLILLNKLELVFNSNYIYLSSDNIKLLLEAKYIIIQNNNYFYENITQYDENGIYTTNQLDTDYKINIYYSNKYISFVKNNITLIRNNNIYYITKYQYNNLQNNELIYINKSLFKIIGLNSVNLFYELLLLNSVEINNNTFNGYYKLGVINKINFLSPTIDYNDPLIYNIDNANLSYGDYYIQDNTLLNKTTEYNTNIFYYDNKGNNINIYVNNNKLYIVNQFDIINQNDILVYNNNIYHIKTIKDNQIYLNNNTILDDGFYDFYYPYQPFKHDIITIDNSGNLNIACDFIELNNIFYSIDKIPSSYYNSSNYARYCYFKNNKYFFDNILELNDDENIIKLDNTTTINIKNVSIIDTQTLDLNNNRMQV
jgi:hypothetical protein